MRLLSSFITKRISSRKFNQIIQQQHHRLLPPSVTQSVISKYLKQQNQIKINQQQQIQSTTINYGRFIHKNPTGIVISKQYKECNLNLVSLDLRNINLKQIYELCSKVNPDLVVVQASPQNYIDQFKLIPKNNGVFSDRAYLSQLILQNMETGVQILNNQIINKLHHIVYPTQPQINNNKILIKDCKGIIDENVVLMSAYYAHKNNKKLILADIPEQSWRQHFCNSHTLMQIQQIFKSICKNISFYQSLKITPFRLATLLKPSLFLSIRDKYMATLIQMLIALRQYKNVLVIAGTTEAQAINQILQQDLLVTQNDTISPIIDYLIGPVIKTPLLRDKIQGWEIIEKHLIMDIMKYGSQMPHLPISTFETTNKIISHYGKALNSYSQDSIMRFRFDKTVYYYNLLKSKMREGQQLKKKILLREAIRNQNDDI